MLTHLFKVSIRNLLRYRIQSLFSLISLALSFTCASFAIYWNYYERTFDAFHSKANRIYKVRSFDPNTRETTEFTTNLAYQTLMEKYPEIEKACVVEYNGDSDLTINGVKLSEDIEHLCVTPEYFEIFDFQWLIGNKNITSWGDNKVAISDKLAKQIAPDLSPIGIKFKFRNKEYEIIAVYKTWPIRSNFNFDIIRVSESDFKPNRIYPTYALLKQGINKENFIHKVESDTFGIADRRPQMLNLWTPLKAVHYSDSLKKQNMHISDVYFFTGASILLTICAVLSYLTLFINRIRIRKRDMALRTICGSSNWQLSKLLMTEYFLLILGASLISCLFFELAMKGFMQLAEIQIERSIVYLSCGGLLALFLIIALIFSYIPIFYYKQKNLRNQIETTPIKIGNSRFRITSICLQLVVSILFIFCATIMLKQVYFLLNENFNIERKQIAIINSQFKEYTMNTLKQIPAIKEIVPLGNITFPFTSWNNYATCGYWEEMPENATPLRYLRMDINNEIASFLSIKIKEGTQSFNLQRGEVIVNEAFIKQMNVTDPIGKTLDNRYKIVGIVYDFLNEKPTKPITPVCLFGSNNVYSIAVKYNGDYDSLEKLIAKTFENTDIKDFKYKITDVEQRYKESMQSEYNLLKLLGIITAISLLIALFGIYAQIIQSCEQHRKEIAIRKVNGAQIKDILLMFFKLYFIQIVTAAIVAFPIGYILMKHWLENYALQTKISLWVFITIFIGITLLVMLCIGWHVWKAANENPAKVIRKE